MATKPITDPFVQHACELLSCLGPVKATRMFGGYGYLIWTENITAPDTAWASGWGGQRIGWNYRNDRILVVFSSREAWMPEVYELARDWGKAQR